MRSQGKPLERCQAEHVDQRVDWLASQDGHQCRDATQGPLHLCGFDLAATDHLARAHRQHRQHQLLQLRVVPRRGDLAQPPCQSTQGPKARERRQECSSGSNWFVRQSQSPEHCPKNGLKRRRLRLRVRCHGAAYGRAVALQGVARILLAVSGDDRSDPAEIECRRHRQQRCGGTRSRLQASRGVQALRYRGPWALKLRGRAVSQSGLSGHRPQTVMTHQGRGGRGQRPRHQRSSHTRDADRWRPIDLGTRNGVAPLRRPKCVSGRGGQDVGVAGHAGQASSGFGNILEHLGARPRTLQWCLPAAAIGPDGPHEALAALPEALAQAGGAGSRDQAEVSDPHEFMPTRGWRCRLWTSGNDDAAREMPQSRSLPHR
mmetsp:Transcript_155278/g.498189  ORF Transcript_155278/g.498189 Transcript_155278/m.498189 type:complete len:374 (+) Transcript_155278:1440-2561(+)